MATIEEVKQSLIDAMSKCDKVYADEVISLAKAYQILCDVENAKAMTDATLKQPVDNRTASGSLSNNKTASSDTLTN